MPRRRVHGFRATSVLTHKTRPHTHAASKRSQISDEPLYRQLVGLLRNDIVRGVFPAGSQLPTEEALAVRFKMSRGTVREALRHLRADGLVSSRQGSGTTVMSGSQSTPFSVHRVTSIAELLAYDAETKYVVERTGMVASEDVASEVGLPASEQWLHLQGLRRRDDASSPPMCWLDVFISSKYAGIERFRHRQVGPLWRLIEDAYGERMAEVEQALRVRTVPTEVAAKLHVEPGSSVVEVRRTYKTTSGEVAEVGVNLYPADTFQFNLTMRRTGDV